MSRNVLEALMQLFALLTLKEEGAQPAREVVAAFLGRRIGVSRTREWIDRFEHHLKAFESRKGAAAKGVDAEAGGMKRTALRSTKVLRACAELNRDLQVADKALVFLRVVEFEKALLKESGLDTVELDEISMEFVVTVADSFGISKSERDCYLGLVLRPADWSEYTAQFDEAFAITPDVNFPGIHRNNWPENTACFLHPTSQIVFVRAAEHTDIELNGELLTDGRVMPFAPGSVLRHPSCTPVFFGDIRRHFLEEEETLHVELKVEDVSHWFNYPNDQALHPMNCSALSGQLVGVMGASGSGKSTLLGLLSGRSAPTAGRVSINGLDVQHSQALNMIGLVPQADMLLEELSVRENLLYTGRLVLDLPLEVIEGRTDDLLRRLGLWGIRELAVGHALHKTISGGQRKRLNIALELMRNPRVLFVDEPTSGLSSKDSEQLMELLKGLTFQGTLVVAVIHQPSAAIFRLFDQLWVLDHGGYPIYTGVPLDALTHFRRLVNHFNAQHPACSACGNLTPEQIFDIVETPVLDQRGRPTNRRRITPVEWNDFYNVLVNPLVGGMPASPEVSPENAPKDASGTLAGGEGVPSRTKQLRTQFARDVSRKLKNRQYLWINALVAPLLAGPLAWLLRYHSAAEAYTFGGSDNLPHFLFVSTIVAIFLGLTVSGEELFRDRLMRDREGHLGVSYGAYLSAKCGVLFIVSALQTLAFALIGSWILEMPQFVLSYWIVLFTTACLANLVGLIFSSLFNSVRVIYIAIPLFIIPQLMLGGTIVHFGKLNPTLASWRTPSWVGSGMISRWSFEALATELAANNAFDRAVFNWDVQIAEAEFYRDRWVPEMRNQIEQAQIEQNQGIVGEATRCVSTEFNRLEKRTQRSAEVDASDGLDADEAGLLLELLNSTLNLERRGWLQAKKSRDTALKALGLDDVQRTAHLSSTHHNEELERWVTGTQSLSAGWIQEGHRIVNTRDALYQVGHWPGADRPFYAAKKTVLGVSISTFWYNIAVLWTVALALFITLRMRLFNQIKRWAPLR
ncbi:MAG: ATP-binding cassette domain-containing protein [Flavobacteriales bacterium]|nr:ATP-binding cassette domain-containing protein [Flavobacteriales bacterium]